MASAIMFAIALLTAAPNGSPVCTPMAQRSVRPRNVIELTLRATPDSARDSDRPLASAHELGHRARLSWDTAAVYAQVFEIVRVDGQRELLQSKHYRRVAVVWWRLGLQCQRVSPKSAVNHDVTELFLPAQPTDSSRPDIAARGAVVGDLRPERDWIQGIPTLDVSDHAWLYAPGYRRAVNLPKTTRGDLTIAEYRDFFERLPTLEMSYAEMESSWREFLRWGDADPRRWTAYPAAQQLCVAAMNLGDSTRTRGRCAR